MEGPADLITDVVGARERTLMAGSAPAFSWCGGDQAELGDTARMGD